MGKSKQQRIWTSLGVAGIAALLGVIAFGARGTRLPKAPSVLQANRGPQVETRLHELPLDPLEDPPAGGETANGEIAPNDLHDITDTSGFPAALAIARMRDEIKERDGAYGYRSKGYLLTADREGVTTALPIKPRDRKRPTLRIALKDIKVGQETLASGGSIRPELRAQARTVYYNRGPVEERYVLHKLNFEQDFVIKELPPTRGEIVVTANVRTNLTAPADGTRGSELLFKGEGKEAFSISNAVAFDAEGRKLPLELAYAEGRVSMTVPAQWVSEAKLPIVVDPLIGSPVLVDNVFFAFGHDLAFNSTTGRYLVAWSEDFGATSFDMVVQELDAAGAPIGSPAVVGTDGHWGVQSREGFPALSYAPTLNSYLITWQGLPFNGSSSAVFGRVLDAAGVPLTASFVVSTGTNYAMEPAIAFDGVDRWLVTYIKDLSTNQWVTALSWVSASGTVTAGGDPASTSFPSGPKVAFHSNLFLLTWFQYAPATNTTSFVGRLLDSSGTFLTPVTSVGPDSSASFSVEASIDGSAGKFLVTWADATTLTLRGRIVNATPGAAISFATSVFDVNTAVTNPAASDFPRSPDIVFSPTANQWFVVYAQGRGSNMDLYVHGVSLSGTPTAPDRLTQSPNDELSPRLARNTITDETLLTYLLQLDANGNYNLYSQKYSFGVPPGAPTAVRATPGNNLVNIQWNAVSTASGYNVKRATTSGGPYTQIATGIAGTSFSDTTATNGTTYFYVVSAVGLAGEGANSNQVQATPTLPSAEVLFVVGSTLLGAGDLALESRLRALGYRTVMRQDSTSTSTDASGKALVVISSTITSGNVNTRFRGATVPVINWENALHDDLGMTSAVAGDFGTTTGQTSLIIANASHPLAAGFSGTIAVSGSSTFSWGIPSAGSVVATLTGANSGKAGIFAYEASTAMPGLQAPARRVGFFLDDLTANNWTPAGVSLFDAAVYWATGGAPGSPPPPSGLVVAPGNGQLTLSWASSAGATSYTVLRATSPGGPYTAVATVSTTSYTDSNLTNGQSYYYVVTASNGALSGYSGEAVGTPQAVSPQVLFVVGTTTPGSLTLGAGDLQIKSRLESLGYTVVAKDAPTSLSSDATGKALIIVSSTPTSADVGDKFKTSSVPVLNWENALHDNFGMTATPAGNFGTTTGQSSIAITNSGHPLAADLSGTLMVTMTGSTFSWGIPDNAAKIATLSGDASKAVIFGYEKGQTMPGLVAPARRVGFFLEDQTAGGLNANGWLLFDAAVRWAVNIVPGSPPAPSGLAATGSAGQISLTWNASSGATSYTVKRSTTSGGPYSTIASIQPQTNHVDTGVMDGTTYYYIVTASAGTAESNPSNEALATPGATRPQALFVVGTSPVPPGSGDEAVVMRLQGLGFDIVLRTGPSSATGDAAGKALVVISSTITSSHVNSKFRDVLVPVITWENVLYRSDYLGMADAVQGTHYSTSSNQNTLLVIDPSYTTAAGLSGTIAITPQLSTFSWGRPNYNATRVVSLAGDNTRSVVFCYEAGVQMPGLIAPARRAGFFLEDSTASVLNASGWALFDASVRWAAAGGPVAPAIPTNLVGGYLNGNVQLSWDVAAGASSYKIKRASVPGGPYTFIGTTTNTTFSESSPADSSTLYYVVSSVQGSAESANSFEAWVRKIEPPSGLNAVAGYQQVQLTWNSSPGATSYYVKRSGGGTFKYIAAPVSTSYLDTDVSNGVSYYYMVSWVNDVVGEGPNSAAVTATPNSTVRALFIGGQTGGAGDSEVQSRLQGMGYSVVVREASTVSVGDATGCALVVISSTVGSVSLDTQFGSLSVPVLTWNPASMSALGMVGSVAGTDYGAQSSETQLSLVDANSGHPLAAGLSGAGVTVLDTSGSLPSTSTSFSWAIPSASGIKIATLATDTSKSTIFGYDALVTMVGMTAPARRVGFFMGDTTAADLNASGDALLEAAIRWASGAPNTPGGLSVGQGSMQLTIQWVPVPGALNYTILRSTDGVNFTPIASGIRDNVYTDSANLSNGATYFYRVVAENAQGASAPSAVISGSPSGAPIVIEINGPPVLRTLGAGDPDPEGNSTGTYTATVRQIVNGTPVDVAFTPNWAYASVPGNPTGSVTIQNANANPTTMQATSTAGTVAIIFTATVGGSTHSTTFQVQAGQRLLTYGDFRFPQAAPAQQTQRVARGMTDGPNPRPYVNGDLWLNEVDREIRGTARFLLIDQYLTSAAAPWGPGRISFEFHRDNNLGPELVNQPNDRWTFFNGQNQFIADQRRGVQDPATGGVVNTYPVSEGTRFLIRQNIARSINFYLLRAYLSLEQFDAGSVAGNGYTAFEGISVLNADRLTVIIADAAFQPIQNNGRDGESIAHEIGHVFGLPHAAQADNLMFGNRPTRTAVNLTPDQLRTARTNLNAMNAFLRVTNP